MFHNNKKEYFSSRIGKESKREKNVSWFIIFNWLASGVVTIICKRKRKILKQIVLQNMYKISAFSCI